MKGKNMITRYAYKNTMSSAGPGKEYRIDSRKINVVKKWHNIYGNPSYVYHMNNGDTYYLVDDFGGLNDVSARVQYENRRKDLFNRY